MKLLGADDSVDSGRVNVLLAWTSGARVQVIDSNVSLNIAPLSFLDFEAAAQGAVGERELKIGFIVPECSALAAE